MFSSRPDIPDWLYRRDAMTQLKFIFVLLACLIFAPAVFAQQYPSCLSAASDIDGDGWGWEFNQSCIVDETSTNTPLCEDTDGDGWGWNGTDTCTVPASSTGTVAGNPGGSPHPILDPAICIDVDGDGYGWDGSDTCIPSNTANTPVTTQSNTGTPSTLICVDVDGDGYGWDGFDTCDPGTIASTPPSGTPQVSDTVTDVVLMMGQSNALGENTLVDIQGVDAPSNNIVVWTQSNGWQIADLCTQIWQKGWFPWRGGVCSNHPAFQIAKGIIKSDPTRKVAIIPTGVAGKPISWWDTNGVAYAQAKLHVETALASLPEKNEVNLVAWSQGEADNGTEDAWFVKLNDLFSRLRSESWVNPQQTIFIAQETKHSSINTKVPLLATDNDNLTGWIPASDLTTKDGVHWSANALREIGNRYANEYLSLESNI